MSDLWQTVPCAYRLSNIETGIPLNSQAFVKVASLVGSIQRTLESNNPTVREGHRVHLDSPAGDITAQLLLSMALNSLDNRIQIMTLNCICAMNRTSIRQMQQFLHVENMWQICPLLMITDLTNDDEAFRVTLFLQALRPIQFHDGLFLQHVLESTDLIVTITQNILFCEGQAVAYPMLTCLQSSIALMSAILFRAPQHAARFVYCIPTVCRLLRDLELPTMPQTSCVVLLVSSLVLWFKTSDDRECDNPEWVHFPTTQLQRILLGSHEYDSEMERVASIGMFTAVAEMARIAPWSISQRLLTSIPTRHGGMMYT